MQLTICLFIWKLVVVLVAEQTKIDIKFYEWLNFISS